MLELPLVFSFPCLRGKVGMGALLPCIPDYTSDRSLSFERIVAGGSPAASAFLLRGQKKGTKEKVVPTEPPLSGYPALLEAAGGCGTCPRKRRAAFEQSSPNSPPLLRYSALQKGGNIYA